MTPTDSAYAWTGKERLDGIPGRLTIQLLGMTNKVDGALIDGAIVYFKVGVHVRRIEALNMAVRNTEDGPYIPG